MTFQKGHRDFVPASSRRNPESRRKISEANRKNCLLGKIGNHGFKNGHAGMKGEKNPTWKGDRAGYHALHIWVRKWKGKPSMCESCGSIGKSLYHWANVDHRYRRVLEDYISMCPKCHKQYDKELATPRKKF